VTREHVAAVDAATGALDSWNPDASNDVNTLAVSPNGSTVYLGGSFEEIGGTVRSFAGAVSASTGEVTSWNPSPNGGVSTIAPAPNGAVVYLGGAFSSISSSGGTVTRSDAAAVDTNNGYDLGWDPQVNGVYSIAASSTTVAVGGQGSDVGDIPQAYIALFAAAPTAAFSWQQSLTSLAVQFTDASSAVSPSTITAWTWNFGDGNTSNAENPDHTYAASGDYDVTLTVTDNNGEQTAVSPATITGWSWTFGDGGSSTAADPDHTYTATGDYQVSLTVTDSNGHHGTFQGSVVVSTPAGSGTGSSGSGTGGSGSGTGGSGSGTGGSGSGTGGSGPSTGGSGSGSGSSGSGSAGSSSSGSGGSDSGSGSGSPTPTPTTVQIQKILNGSLIPSGAHVSITTILSGGSFKTPFTPPEPGKLTVNWYAKHRSGRSGHRSNSKTKLILVASCAETFSSDKKSTVKIKLTSAGRNVLRSAKQVALTADDTFTPKGKKAIKTSKQFTLKAGRK
jgi:PKD repeat protein